MRLKSKIIIVTGASSGIGRAAAITFAREGASLVLSARRSDHLSKVAEEIEAMGGRAATVAGDVTDPNHAEALVRCAETRFGRLDGALNNAGALGDLGPIDQMTLDNWRTVIDTNLTAAFLGARAQIPAMRRCGGGSIVFTGSFVGQAIGLPGMAAYGASKAGLVGLTQVLAAECGLDRIRVNTLMPGGTQTSMAGGDPEYLKTVARLHALGRLAEPEEIAQAALFLVEDGASFVTGSSLVADGGNSIFKPG